MPEILEKLILFYWPRKILEMTIPLFLAAPLLAEGLQKLGLRVELLEHTAVRLLLAVSVLCIGLISFSVTLLVAYKPKIKEYQQEIESLKFSLVQAQNALTSKPPTQYIGGGGQHWGKVE